MKSELLEQIQSSSSAFIKAASLAGIVISPEEIDIEISSAPHIAPKKLPAGKMAVYIFTAGNECLKVGKAGSKSQARYISQHYGFNAPSTLAKSVFAERDYFNLPSATEKDIGPWIKSACDRANILLPETYGPHVLNFLEAFMLCRLQPRYEGYESQQAVKICSPA